MLKIDKEFKEIIPPLSTEEFEQLEKNILLEGIRDPIVAWGNIIIDGHNRYAIAKKHHLQYETMYMFFNSREDVIDWIINNQLGRRNLTKETMSYLRGLQYTREKKKSIETLKQNTPLPQSEGTGETAERLATQHNVSRATIERDADYAKAIDAIVKNTAPEVKHQILNREINVTKKDIERISKLEPEKQKSIIEKIATGEAKSVVDANRRMRKEEVHEVPIIEGKYRVIYADCPWNYGNKLVEGYGAAENHYPTMSIEELCELPIKELAEDNAVLFFWVTSPLLEECFPVIKSWGFKYKTSFVWDKVKHNMGHYNSVRHELLLICTKGSCLPDSSKLIDSVVEIERSQKHSEKPEEFRNIINTLYTSGAKIELFSRKKVEGWTAWGNQS